MKTPLIIFLVVLFVGIIIFILIGMQSMTLPTRGPRPEGKVHGALYDRDIEGLKKALAEGADPNELDPVFKEAALHVAARKTDYEAVTILVNAGADPNRTDQFGQTAFESLLASVNIDQPTHLSPEETKQFAQVLTDTIRPMVRNGFDIQKYPNALALVNKIPDEYLRMQILASLSTK